MNIKQVAQSLLKINGNGKFAQSLFDEYYEQSNVTMTVVNVITEIIEKITKKQFDISIGLRVLTIDSDEKIYISINSNISMITVTNSKTKNIAVLKTDKFERSLTKFKSLMINDIVYHVFDTETVGYMKHHTFMH